MDNSVSVLLPVHAGVAHAHFRRCLESVYAQSVLPTEVLIVEDGPLTQSLREVLADFSRASPKLTRISLRENSGPGVANGIGLQVASCTWIAKVDADDISCPNRLERQLEVLRATGVDVLGTAMSEFIGREDNIVAIRRNPADHAAISRRMAVNSPINHPSCMYRRELALDAGGYSALRYMEDYDLFARLLQQGARMANIEEPLVLFRAGDEAVARRRSFAMMRCELQLQRNLRRYGVIGPIRMVANLVARSAVRVLPSIVLHTLYRRLNY